MGLYLGGTSGGPISGGTFGGPISGGTSGGPTSGGTSGDNGLFYTDEGLCPKRMYIF